VRRVRKWELGYRSGILPRPWRYRRHRGGWKLKGRIVPASGGFGSSSTIAADGTFGDHRFGIYGAVNSSLTRAVIAGTMDDHPVRLVVEVRRSRGRTTTITGTWRGPLPLLLVVVGSALWFV
jgi:hypothetical protein